MNGRVYDPTLGRFIQADPHTQAPSDSQSLNRYSYVKNNPLSYTDPTGYFWKKLWKGIKKYWRQIVSIAVMFIPGVNIIALGFISGYISTDTLKGALIGAFSAGFGGGSILRQAMIGGITSVASGGKFWRGFASAGLTAGIGGAFGGKTNNMKFPARVITKMIIGGTISQITGGKFANGARSAAMNGIAEEISTQAGKYDKNGDLEPGGVNDPVVDTGLGLEWKDGKLRGEILWGCNASEMAKCAAFKKAADDLVTNNDILDVKNVIVDSKVSEFEAHLVFYNCNPASCNTDKAGFWNPSNNTLHVNEFFSNGLDFIYKHEYGHALGLPHMRNRTENFMSYYNHASRLTGGSSPAYKISGHHKWGLQQAYTPKDPWWKIW